MYLHAWFKFHQWHQMNVRDIRHQRFTLGDITLLTTSPTHIWPHHLNRTSAVLICAHIWYQIHRRAGGFSWPRLRTNARGWAQKRWSPLSKQARQMMVAAIVYFARRPPNFVHFQCFCKRAMCAPDFSPTSFVFEHNQHQPSYPLGDDNHLLVHACFGIMRNSHNQDVWSLW